MLEACMEILVLNRSKSVETHITHRLACRAPRVLARLPMPRRKSFKASNIDFTVHAGCVV